MFTVIIYKENPDIKEYLEAKKWVLAFVSSFLVVLLNLLFRMMISNQNAFLDKTKEDEKGRKKVPFGRRSRRQIALNRKLRSVLKVSLKRTSRLRALLVLKKTQKLPSVLSRRLRNSLLLAFFARNLRKIQKSKRISKSKMKKAILMKQSSLFKQASSVNHGCPKLKKTSDQEESGVLFPEAHETPKHRFPLGKSLFQTTGVFLCFLYVGASTYTTLVVLANLSEAEREAQLKQFLRAFFVDSICIQILKVLFSVLVLCCFKSLKKNKTFQKIILFFLDPSVLGVFLTS